MEVRIAGTAGCIAIEVHRLAGPRAVKIKRICNTAKIRCCEFLAIRNVIIVCIVTFVDFIVEQIARCGI